MRRTLTSALALFVGSTFSVPAATSAPGLQRMDYECGVVEDYEDYYDVELDEDYGFRSVIDQTASALYQGPLMREGDPAGLGNLKSLFREQRELTVRRIQEIVQSHLYDSDEFRNLLSEKTRAQGDVEASHMILNSIYDHFDYEPEGPAEEDLDACLIRNRRAHLVVTKALIRMPGVRD